MSTQETLEQETETPETPETPTPAETVETPSTTAETPAAVDGAITPEQAHKEGWSKSEIEAGQKRGMIKSAAPKPAAAAPGKPAAPAAAKPGEQPKDAPKPGGGLPDYEFTPEEQKWVEERFKKGHPFRAFYFRSKNERQGRQAAEERERQHAAKIAELEAKLTGKPAGEVPEGEDDLDKPLTARALQQWEQRKALEAQKQHEAIAQRRVAISTAQKDQEEFAKTIYPDFLETAELASDLIQNIEAYLPEKHKQQEAVELLLALQKAAAQADRLGVEDYNGAHIAYRLGQLHPKYGKAKAPAATAEPNDGPSMETPKPSGGQPEKSKRIEEVTQRRPSSASVPSGTGKRTIAPSDVDLATLNGMTFKEREAFSKSYPDLYQKLLRG